MSRAVPLDHEFNKAAFSQLLRTAQGERQQKQFANDIGMSKSYLNCYLGEKMDRPLTPATLQKICYASGGRVSYEDLLSTSGYDPQKHIISMEFKIPGAKPVVRKIYKHDLDAMDEQYDFIDTRLNAVTGTISNALASKGYKWSGKPTEDNRLDFRVTLYDEPITEWGFIYLETKDVDLPINSPISLLRINQYANALLFAMGKAREKISFITTYENIYEKFKNASLPVLALYASVILIDTDELTVIKEEPIKSYLEASSDIPTLI
ncbi:MAG: helix-turn-helix domain-containing protein [Lachnospiraceae bacterium]|nr:helix-turn-helix domain-containing protein [Lachnospiraceae bacterium]